MRGIIILFINLVSLSILGQAESIGVFNEPMQSADRIYPGQENDQKLYSLALFREPDYKSKTNRRFIKENIHCYNDFTYMMNATSVLLENGERITITNSSSSYSSVIHLNVEEFYLTFSEWENDFIKVRLAEESYWLSVSEINKAGIELILWKDYFNIGSNYTFVALNNIRLNEEPTLKSKALLYIPAHNRHKVQPDKPYYEIESIFIIDGPWMQVVVKQWKSWSDMNLELPAAESLTGWIKFLDDDGHTLIFSSRNFGC